VLLAVFDDFFLRSFHSPPQDHQGFDALSPVLIRDADDGCFQNGRMGMQDRFDFPGINVLGDVKLR
jgi:hypothetical protein